ncbi:hypothetical protein GCM10020219_008700 [Nonomuraea dietziae]
MLDPGLNPRGHGPNPLVLTIGKQVKKLDPADFPVPVEPLDKIRIPRNFNARAPKERANLVSTLLAKIGDRDLGKPPRARDHAVEDEEIIELRRLIRQHPCHGCADREDHARWAERYYKLLRETEGLRRRVEGRSHVISRTFDRICAVLEQLGYLEDENVTTEGRRLGRLYTELDLLTAECLRTGLWEELDAAELAACVSALVFESRQADDARRPKIPAGRAQDALTAMVRLWGELEGIEKTTGCPSSASPISGSPGRPSAGRRATPSTRLLSDGINGNELAAGDFVRWVKQLMDLLGQVGNAAPPGSRSSRPPPRPWTPCAEASSPTPPCREPARGDQAIHLTIASDGGASGVRRRRLCREPRHSPDEPDVTAGPEGLLGWRDGGTVTGDPGGLGQASP